MPEKILLVVLVAYLFGASAAVAGNEGFISIQESERGLTLGIQDRPLNEVLDAIHRKTGVHFKISDSVKKDSITVQLDAPDWKTGLQKLLEPYDKLLIWNEPLDRSTIHILSRLEGELPQAKSTAIAPPVASPAVPGTSGSGPVNPSPIQQSVRLPCLKESDKPKAMGLDERHLKKIARGNLKSPVPLYVFLDPDVKPYLKQFGIESPEDLKDTGKAMRARIHARRFLKR